MFPLTFSYDTTIDSYFDAERVPKKAGEFENYHKLWFRIQDHMLHPVGRHQIGELTAKIVEKLKKMKKEKMIQSYDSIFFDSEEKNVFFANNESMRDNFIERKDLNGYYVIINIRQRPDKCITVYSIEDGKTTALNREDKTLLMNELSMNIKHFLQGLEHTKKYVFFNKE
eukprot:763388-Hanusia_phi.AAC.11